MYIKPVEPSTGFVLFKPKPQGVFVMTRIIGVLFGLFVSLFCMATPASAGWHEWSQVSRNQAIVDRTYQNNTHYVGQNCKEWARTVVYSASGGLVTIPTTQPSPNNYLWYSDPNVVGRSGLIQYAQPGEIVQMRLKSGLEHTAIVLSVSGTGVTFIESNWYSTAYPNYVFTRYVSFTDFYNQVSAYSIYYIL